MVCKQVTQTIFSTVVWLFLFDAPYLMTYTRLRKISMKVTHLYNLSLGSNIQLHAWATDRYWRDKNGLKRNRHLNKWNINSGTKQMIELSLRCYWLQIKPQLERRESNNKKSHLITYKNIWLTPKIYTVPHPPPPNRLSKWVL